MTSINQILRRAKQQPKLGYPPIDITNDEQGKKQAADDLDRLTQSMRQAFGGDMISLIENFAKTYAQFSDAISNENTQLQMGLGKLMSEYDKFQKSQIATIQSSTWLEQRNAKLNSSFKISSKQAAKLGQTYDEMSSVLKVGGEKVRTYAQSLNKIVPGTSAIIASNKKFGESLMMTQDILVNQQGLTDDQANSFELYAAGLGKTGISQLGGLKAVTAEFEKISGMTGMFADVSAEISGLGADIQMQYGKLPGSLELAVMKSRMLGMSFSQMETMASNMMNIEESVNQELEYQLLSGERLVDANGRSLTEKIRMAKVTNDANALAEATAEIYETQSKTLEGNNYLAKEALAKTMGMSTAEMMKAYQTQKLIKSMPGMDKDKVDKILKMSPADYAKEMQKAENAGNVAIFDKLRSEAESTKTTDQLILDALDKDRTFKITEVAPDQEKEITGARKQILSGDLEKEMKNFLDTFIGKDGTLSKAVGGLQIKGEVFDNFSKALSGYSTMIPVLGDTIAKIIEGLNTYVQTTLGTKKNTASTPGGGANVPDGILVNDAMIQFHPADKFATVPDGAALLASTERGKLDSAVDTLTGGGGKTAVVDPAPIARAVAAAVQQAMAGMKIEMDGYNLAKALEFSNRTINKI